MCPLQTAEQITAIVEEARKSPHGVADWDNDEYLDGALNQEDYGGGSYDEWGEIHTSLNPLSARTIFDVALGLILALSREICTRKKIKIYHTKPWDIEHLTSCRNEWIDLEWDRQQDQVL